MIKVETPKGIVQSQIRLTQQRIRGMAADGLVEIPWGDALDRV